MTQTAITNDKPKPSALGLAIANAIRDHLDSTLGTAKAPADKPVPLRNRYKLPGATDAKPAANKAATFKLPKAEV